MNLRRSALLLVAALLTPAMTAAHVTAGEAHLYLAPYYFDSRLTGDGRVSDGTSGSDFDLEDTLGIEPGETARGIDGFVSFLGNRIEFSYSSVNMEGRQDLAEDLVFDGTTFPDQEKIESEVDLTRYKLMYGFHFDLKVVNVGFVVGAHLVDIDARVSGAGSEEEKSLRVPVPVVGATLGIHPISRLAIHAEVSGFSITVSGVEAKLVDGYAGLDFLFLPHFGVTAGYRYFLLDAKDDDEEDDIDLVQRGAYAGLVLHL